MSTNNNNNKKAKTDDEHTNAALLAALDTVRQHLLASGLAHNKKDEFMQRAVQAALRGLDQEKERAERDAKLQRRFMQELATAAPAATASVRDNLAMMPAELMEQQHAATASNLDESSSGMISDNDWHDIEHEKVDDKDDVPDTDDIGKRLARQVVHTLAQQAVQVATPRGAMAVALHAALRCLGFACTGLAAPPAAAAAATGFAAPVRELKVFLPDNWEQQNDVILLRYRKRSIGAVVLMVELQDNDTVVSVALAPGNNEPLPELFKFALADHLNLDSFAKAKMASAAATVSPTLHYKQLAVLLQQFVARFDVGGTSSLDDLAADNDAPHYVDTRVQNLPSHQPQLPTTTPSNRRPAGDEPWHTKRPTIDNAFPLRANDPHGDFAGDLAPGGVAGPHFGRVDPSGMVMGPNHPIFTGGGGIPGGNTSGGSGGGFGMQPRFDPFGPPGGPTDPDIDDTTRPGSIPGPDARRGMGGNGNPNPDHLRPPNNLNNNMFM